MLRQGLPRPDYRQDEQPHRLRCHRPGRGVPQGVKIQLIICGICCLRPGVPGISGKHHCQKHCGRFLSTPASTAPSAPGESAAPHLHLGSADMMTRNTQRRVEVICPVYATQIKARLNHILDILLRDTVKAGPWTVKGAIKKSARPGRPASLLSRTSSWTRPFRSCREVGIRRPCPALRPWAACCAVSAAADEPRRPPGPRSLRRFPSCRFPDLKMMENQQKWKAFSCIVRFSRAMLCSDVPSNETKKIKMNR